jgi:hypothetical protein
MREALLVPFSIEGFHRRGAGRQKPLGHLRLNEPLLLEVLHVLAKEAMQWLVPLSAEALLICPDGYNSKSPHGYLLLAVDASSCQGKKNGAPLLAMPSAHTRPPWRVTIR